MYANYILSLLSYAIYRIYDSLLTVLQDVITFFPIDTITIPLPAQNGNGSQSLHTAMKKEKTTPRRWINQLSIRATNHDIYFDIPSPPHPLSYPPPPAPLRRQDARYQKQTKLNRRSPDLRTNERTKKKSAAVVLQLCTQTNNQRTNQRWYYSSNDGTTAVVKAESVRVHSINSNLMSKSIHHIYGIHIIIPGTIERK